MGGPESDGNVPSSTATPSMAPCGVAMGLPRSTLPGRAFGGFFPAWSLERAFAALGRAVERGRWAVLVVTVAGCLAAAGAGLPRLKLVSGVEELFVPANSAGMEDRALAESLFLRGDEDAYEFGHDASPRPEIIVILELADPRSAFSDEGFRVLRGVEDFLRSFRLGNCDAEGAPTDATSATYSDLCARKKTGGECAEGFGTISSLEGSLPAIREGRINLTYPIMDNEVTGETYFFPKYFGGPILANDGDKEVLLGARAIRLAFPLREGSYEDVYQLAAVDCLLKEVKVPDSVGKLQAICTKSIELELADNLKTSADLIDLSIGLVAAFSVLATLRPSPAASKSAVAMAGICVALVASAASWGLLALAGHPFQVINMASVFLLLGVGLDDTFVMIASWERAAALRRGHPRAMMGEVYSEAGVAITITSVTNIAAFAVGFFTSQFESIKLFCLYTGAALLAIYLLTLTAYGAILAVAMHMEDQLASWNFPGPKLWWGLAGVLDRSYKDLTDLAELLGEKVVACLNSSRGRAIVIQLFMVYVATSTLCAWRVEEGLDRPKLGRGSSNIVGFFHLEDTFYRESPYRFQVVLPDPLDYWNETVMSEVSMLLGDIRSSEFVSQVEGYEENWLAEFRKYLKEEEGTAIAHDQEVFMKNLREFLDLASGTPIAKDVLLEDGVGGGKVAASRFVFQSSKLPGSKSDKEMLAGLRRITNPQRWPSFRVLLVHPTFPFVDQLLEVLPSTAQSVFMSFAAVFAVTLVCLGDLASTVIVAATILSIELGVYGLMFPLGINLDVISMIILIMCVGFSVDFSAHIANHFSRSSLPTAREKLTDCLRAYASPIGKSAASTLLGVSPLLFTDSYILQSFAKLMFSVVLIGVGHSLLILPVVLAAVSELRCRP